MLLKCCGARLTSLFAELSQPQMGFQGAVPNVGLADFQWQHSLSELETKCNSQQLIACVIGKCLTFDGLRLIKFKRRGFLRDFDLLVPLCVSIHHKIGLSVGDASAHESTF